MSPTRVLRPGWQGGASLCKVTILHFTLVSSHHEQTVETGNGRGKIRDSGRQEVDHLHLNMIVEQPSKYFRLGFLFFSFLFSEFILSEDLRISLGELNRL